MVLKRNNYRIYSISCSAGWNELAVLLRFSDGPSLHVLLILSIILISN